jgi:hypothetical protein
MSMFVRAPALHVCVGALVMLAPVLLNGFPFWFFDTANYQNVGHSIFSNIEGLFHHAARAPPPVSVQESAPATNGVNPWLYQIGTRSPLYSSMLYFASTMASYWVVAIIQGLCGAWLISACLRAFGLGGLRSLLAAIVPLTLASTLPYFSGELMPDVFAGYAFIALLLPGASAGRLSLLERYGISLLAFLSVEMHNTILALAIILMLSIAALAWLGRDWRRRFRNLLIWIVAPLALALCFNFVYSTAVAFARGAAPSNPPYLVARVLADGPGRLYLRDACAHQVRYELCKYADRPLDDVNQILWDTGPNTGVFMLATADSKLHLIHEERRFVVQTILHYPVAELGTMAVHAIQLLPRNDIAGELSLSPISWQQMQLGELAPRADGPARASLAFRRTYPFGFVDGVNGIALFCAIGFLFWRFTRVDVLLALRSEKIEAIEIRVFAATGLALLLWVVCNALLCGTFSGVYARYQARILWLIPMFALLAFFRLGHSANTHLVSALRTLN